MSDLLDTIKSSNLHKWGRVAVMAVAILVSSFVIRTAPDGSSHPELDLPKLVRTIADELDKSKHNETPRLEFTPKFELAPPKDKPSCGCNGGKGCSCGDDCGCTTGCECGDACDCDPCECGTDADIADIDIPQPVVPDKFDELQTRVVILESKQDVHFRDLVTRIDALSVQIAELDKECERIDERADHLSLGYGAVREAVLEQHNFLRGLQLQQQPQQQQINTFKQTSSANPFGTDRKIVQNAQQRVDISCK